MATITLDGLAAMACGLPGRGMVRVARDGFEGLWMCRVLSQEAEMRMAVISLVSCQRKPFLGLDG